MALNQHSFYFFQEAPVERFLAVLREQGEVFKKKLQDLGTSSISTFLFTSLKLLLGAITMKKTHYVSNVDSIWYGYFDIQTL